MNIRKSFNNAIRQAGNVIHDGLGDILTRGVAKTGRDLVIAGTLAAVAAGCGGSGGGYVPPVDNAPVITKVSGETQDKEGVNFTNTFSAVDSDSNISNVYLSGNPAWVQIGSMTGLGTKNVQITVTGIPLYSTTSSSQAFNFDLNAESKGKVDTKPISWTVDDAVPVEVAFNVYDKSSGLALGIEVANLEGTNPILHIDSEKDYGVCWDPQAINYLAYNKAPGASTINRGQWDGLGNILNETLIDAGDAQDPSYSLSGNFIAGLSAKVGEEGIVVESRTGTKRTLLLEGRDPSWRINPLTGKEEILYSRPDSSSGKYEAVARAVEDLGGATLNVGTADVIGPSSGYDIRHPVGNASGEALFCEINGTNTRVYHTPDGILIDLVYESNFPIKHLALTPDGRTLLMSANPNSAGFGVYRIDIKDKNGNLLSNADETFAPVIPETSTDEFEFPSAK
jgi:predicted small lipoprotein YifL